MSEQHHVEDSAPAGAQRGRTRTYLIAGAAVLLLAVIASVVTFTLVGGDGPRDTVESYLDAAQDGDAAAMADHLCAPVRQAAARSGGVIFNQEGDLLRAEIRQVREAERTAEVTIESDFSHTGIDGPVRTETITLALVKEGDEWLICGYRRTAGED